MKINKLTSKSLKNIVAHPDSSFNDSSRVVALGYFDGVHLGHQQLLHLAVAEAQEKNLVSAVQTFTLVPKIGTDSQKIYEQRPWINTLNEKINNFTRAGLEEIFLWPFLEEIACLAPKEFLDILIKQYLKAKSVVVGEDYRFGLNRKGDCSFLQEWATKNEVNCIISPTYFYKDRPISSTWIRQLISTGDVVLANQLLGYTVSYKGIVEYGQQLGRKLGFPTINLSFSEGKIIPAYGVYSSIVYLPYVDEFLPSISSVGVKPTIRVNDPRPLMETYIYDIDLDLYNQPVQIFLLNFIRAEEKFENLNQLKLQVNKDMNDVKNYHQNQMYDWDFFRKLWYDN